MEIYLLNPKEDNSKFLSYLETVDWNAGKILYKVIESNSIKEKLGDDANIFYSKEGQDFVGFFTIVNQDYISLPELEPFIAMVWVDPKYRGRGISRKFIDHAEKIIGKGPVHILTQHKGLYEKMGYKLIDQFDDSIHDMDYLYYKNLG